MMVQIDMDMPKSCFWCRKRKSLHIDGRIYQMCGLNEDGYLTESWFKQEDLKEDFISPHCPLKEVDVIPKDQYEQRLKADMVAMLTKIQLEIEEMTPTHHNPDWSLTDLVSIGKVNEFIQQEIDKLSDES